MRTLLLSALVFTVMFAIPAFAEYVDEAEWSFRVDQRNDLQRDGLLGNVETVLLERAKSVDDESAGRIKLSLTTYNSAGNIVETVRYDESGNEIGKDQYHYDSQGRLSSQEIWSKGELQCKQEYAYDAAGLLISAKDSSQDEDSLCSLEYDKKGRVTNQAYTAPDGELLYRLIISYSDEKKKVHCDQEHEDDDAIPYAELIFDEQDRVIERKQYEGGELTNRWKFQYDKNGDLAECRWLDMDDALVLVEFYEYENYDTGNWTKQVYYRGMDEEDREIKKIAYRTIEFGK